MTELDPVDGLGECDEKVDEGLTEEELNKYYFLPFPDTNTEGWYAKCSSNNPIVCINKPQP